MDSKYKDYTRDQLLKRIQELEEAQVEKSPKKKNYKGKTDNKRPFDMSKYVMRKVAFRIAYLGWNYCGYASQNRPEEIPCIEDALFRALVTCRLIEDIEQSDYSRCGRTDKGVSGLGQVIALNVRSKQQKSDFKGTYLPADQELPYIDTLNRMLPSDIRVLAWAPVDSEFNARFHCIGRTYKYFFSRGKMNIENMRRACSYFEGQHDFRNFCKMDASKNVLSYERLIMKMTISPVQYTQTAGIGEGTDFYEIELKGTAFLWHQVRFMMSVLFLVGQGHEEPEVIRDLLDIEKVPSKPDFPMASDLPLVLYDCHFKEMDWHYTTRDTSYEAVPSSFRTYCHYTEEWTVQMIRSLTCQNYLTKIGDSPVMMPDNIIRTVADFAKMQQVVSPSGSYTIVLGGGKETRLTKYKKLIDRPRCDTDELKKEKFEVRKKRKLDRISEQDSNMMESSI